MLRKRRAPRRPPPAWVSAVAVVCMAVCALAPMWFAIRQLQKRVRSLEEWSGIPEGS